MDNTIEGLQARLVKAGQIFNEQKQTISNLEQKISYLESQLESTNKSYDELVSDFHNLEVENDKLKDKVSKLKLELGEISKDPFVIIDTATTALNKHEESNQNVANGKYTNTFAPINTMENIISSKLGIEHDNNTTIFQI
jgi:regulator of replication initiation timing